MDEIDRKLLAELQKGLSFAAEPFNAVAQELGIKPEEVVARLNLLKEQRVIRRFGASIKPNNIGFFANAMVAWNVPKGRVREVGDYMSKLREVSHCYEREPVSGRWEYNLYTVMHAKERADVERMVKQVSEETGITDYKILFSTRDLRRTKLDRGVDAKDSGLRKLPTNCEEANDP